MQTALLLAARYDGMPIITLDVLCRDFFQHLDPTKLQKKVLAGEIPLPIVRIEASQKATRGVHVADLAIYLDRQRDAARKELAQLMR
jgi:hypothetical protein